MRALFGFSVVLLTLSAAHTAEAQLGGLLDRVKRKADEAAAEVRDVRRGVESATDVDGRAEREVDRAVADGEQAVPTAERLERRAEHEIETTDPVQDVRAVERDVRDVTTADRRAQAAARAEVGRVEREVGRATDLDGRTRAAAAQTDPAIAVREAERNVRDVTEADERVQGGLEREVRAIEQTLENATR